MLWRLLFLLMFLGACSTTHFGVPEEAWNRMGEAERLEAMRGYNERARLREEAAQREAEARRQGEREAALAREVRVRAIHEGRGRPGDLIRVSIQGGEARLGGKHRAYAPLAFSLASGEVRQVEVLSAEHKHMSYRARLGVAYEDGLLLIDTPDAGNDARAGHLTFDPAWRHGGRYRLDTRGPLELRGVEVMVSTLPMWGERR
ncbi:MAG: Hsp20/alpha crystallin family protein [Pseudomonadota bacterium]|nr:Hsp20/alpha crystallin family protein [Pseudomonadota bacterium]MDP1902909.1 Hsp20/alpha crystallin family protein [Pseudomonadota bacterium]MDP2353008.1 Hsp20/alpha crystallin family protein [Pseudomonadota bacterium]